MPSRHTELLWSPHFPEVFAIGSSEHLKLYEFSGTEERQAQQKVQLIGSVTDVQQLKCVAWSPNPEEPWTLAVGTAVGKVVLHDLRLGEGAPTSALCEFVPRFQRVCFSLAWNGINRHQIAAGLDKVRGDSGVLVWDLNAQSATQQARGSAGGAALGAGHARPPPELHCGSALRSSGVAFDTADDFSSCVAFDISSVGAVHCDEVPAAECGNSEAAVSVAWLPGSAHCLLAGTGFKWLRLYDLRSRPGASSLSCPAHAKAVYGVTFDPFDDTRLATYSDDADGIVKVWDVRKLKDSEPLVSLAAGDEQGAGAPPGARLHGSARGGKALAQVGWCATRRGVLGTVGEGSASLCLWDVEAGMRAQQLENASGAASAGGARLCERVYRCEAPALGFAWHPSQHSRMLLLLQGPRRGNTVDHDLALKDLCLLPPTPLAWSPADELLYASSGDAAPNRQQLRLAGPTWADAHAHDGRTPPTARARPPPLLWRARAFAAEEGADGGGDAAAAAGAAARGGDGAWAVDVSQSIRARAARGYALDAAANLEVLGSTRAAASSAAEQLHLVAAWGWLASRDAPALARPAPPPPSSRMNPPARPPPAASPPHRFHRGLVPPAMPLPPTLSPSLAGSASGGATTAAAAAAAADGDGAPPDDPAAGACELLLASEPSDEAACPSGLKLYTSAARARVLQRCGWEVCTTADAIEAAVLGVEQAGAWEKAALVALLHAGAHEAFHELEAAVATLYRGSTACAAAQQPERAAELRMMAMVVAGYQPGARLWSAAVHSTAQALASPHLRLLLTVLGTAHAAAAAATAATTADVTADVDAAATLSPTAATAAVSAPALALDDDGGDELSRLLLHMLLAPAGAAGGGGGGEDGDGDGPLLFADGLAVACRFLPDAPLRSLLPRLLEQAVARGSLQGLCLCGMGEEALPLLQAYVDRTVDVQTAVLLLASANPRLLEAPHPRRWLDAYRELLNLWQLYHARCRLDIAIAAQRRALGGAAVPSPPPVQVYARCGYCNSSLVTGSGAPRMNAGSGQPLPGRAAESTLRRPTPKASVCPNPKCKKALPRCAVCLQHMGCPDPADGQAAAARTADGVWRASSSAFSHWMVWCQSCRHGGHADHMREWFERHDECPVSGCSCRCSLRDSLPRSCVPVAARA